MDEKREKAIEERGTMPVAGDGVVRRFCNKTAMGWIAAVLAAAGLAMGETCRGETGAAVGTVAGETTTIALLGGAEMEMVWCPPTPPGGFPMGAPEGTGLRDETLHRVTLTEGFWLAKTEVTQAQWKSVMGDNPSYFKGDDLPVDDVSWNDAQEFCRKTGLRLPTEAEWEYACRAGSEKVYSWGDALNGEKANCDGHHPFGMDEKGPYREKTLPVGSYEPNNWGLLDMHGNVYEWCEDLYGEYPAGAVTNPVGAAEGTFRVMRGGSWFDGAKFCRSAFRRCDAPGNWFNIYGFRPCRSAEGP